MIFDKKLFLISALSLFMLIGVAKCTTYHLEDAKSKEGKTPNSPHQVSDIDQETMTDIRSYIFHSRDGHVLSNVTTFVDSRAGLYCIKSGGLSCIPLKDTLLKSEVSE